MELALAHFLTHMYWIDVTIIVSMTLLCGVWIGIIRTRAIVKKNTLYNQNLSSLREEIYQEYEKNFFL